MGFFQNKIVVPKLRLRALVSSLILSAPILQAHEVTPSIGNLSLDGSAITLELRVLGEAFLAGIDLDGLASTTDSDGDAAYDALRATDPAVLEPQLEAFFAGWSAMQANADDKAMDFQVSNVAVPEVGNTDLPRASVVTLVAEFPAGAKEMTLHWPGGAGDLVLRQQGVPDPWTGFLTGGDTSPPIQMRSPTDHGFWSRVFCSTWPFSSQSCAG